jgi:biotin synthase
LSVFTLADDIPVGKLAQAVIAGEDISRNDAVQLLELEGDDRFELLHWANRIRLERLGREISLCCIVSARTSRCSEDCRFCAQSGHYHTEFTPQQLNHQDLLAAAEKATKLGAHSFGIVSSGYGPTEPELNRLEEVFRNISRSVKIQCCASLGCLSLEQARRLKAMGVKRCHHNLETSERFFPEIVSTHSYEVRLETIRAAKEAGLEVCSGGIMGLGENLEDRVDLALTLRDLDVDCVPINFLNPIPGTPLEHAPPISPMTALQIIAVFRFVLPDKQIKIAGGREHCLRDLQSWIFYAGASSCMVGSYLTTTGRKIEDDFQMIKDLELPLLFGKP